MLVLQQLQRHGRSTLLGFASHLVMRGAPIKAVRELLGLGDQIAAVLGDDGLKTIERARTIATLAAVSLRAIEAGDLTGRIEALEGVLSRRRERKRREP